MAFNISETELPEVRLVKVDIFADERGLFSETYSYRQFRELGVDVSFIQDNHSVSQLIGTVRGLHYQLSPFAQDKLVRVTRGAIFDVAVDVRRGSPNFGKHVAVVLDADDWKQIFVPIGFAHGLCTLKPDTEVSYKVSNYYSREHDRGILWSDPELGIAWPVAVNQALLSDKDRHQPKLHDAKDLL